MNETATFADHLVVLGRGRLLADTPMRDFIDAHSERRVRIRTTDPASLRAALRRKGLDAVATGDGRWTVAGARAEEIGALAATDGIPVLELADESASLEEAYLALTAGATEFTSAATPLQEA
jgi:ABC-2 type transport system ATP-binding protein